MRNNNYKTDTSFNQFILRYQLPLFSTHTRYLVTSPTDLLKMKSFVVIAVAATAVMAQSPPAGCQASRSGTFNIQTVNVTSSGKRDLSRRQLAGALTLSLKDGIVKDQAGRQGYIASNYQ